MLQQDQDYNEYYDEHDRQTNSSSPESRVDSNDHLTKKLRLSSPQQFDSDTPSPPAADQKSPSDILFERMMGEPKLEYTSSLYKVVKQEWWNKGKQSSQSQDLVFMSERLALLYACRIAIKSPVFTQISKLDPSDPLELLYLETDELRGCLDLYNSIIQDSPTGWLLTVVEMDQIPICTPQQLFPFLTRI